jgi:hypothetical protein
MFHPSMVCSIRPFQQSSLICSRKNSAMPLFHPAQQDGGGVGAFEEDGLVGGEQGDAAGGEFFFQFSALKVSRAERLMSSQTTAANAGAGRRPRRAGRPPSVAGDADAVDDDRLLLVRKAYGNQWDIPGGCVDVGESPAAACQRELREELGIDRQPQRLLVMEWAPKHPAKMTPP